MNNMCSKYNFLVSCMVFSVFASMPSWADLAISLRTVGAVANEIYTTELTYNKALKDLLAQEAKIKKSRFKLLNIIANKKLNLEMASLKKMLKISNNFTQLFGTLKTQLNHNMQEFVPEVFQQGLAILEYILLEFNKPALLDNYKKFTVYQSKYPDKSIKLPKEVSSNEFNSNRITPTQRMPRYALLMKELIKNMVKVQQALPLENSNKLLISQYKLRIENIINTVDNISKKINENLRRLGL